jgi:hypothetical protein
MKADENRKKCIEEVINEGQLAHGLSSWLNEIMSKLMA